MTEGYRDPMFEIFISEARTVLSNLEEIFLKLKEGSILFDTVKDEILRLFHTLKGSSSMMGYMNIGRVCHKAEELFVGLKDININKDIFETFIRDMFKTVDFLNIQLDNIEKCLPIDSSEDIEILIENIINLVSSQNTAEISNREKSSKNYSVHLYFENGCEMENVRAFAVVNKLKDFVLIKEYNPADLDNPSSSEIIKKSGFRILLESHLNKDDIYSLFDDVIFLSDLKIEEIKNQDIQRISSNGISKGNDQTNRQKIINVNIEKVDHLVDLIGEIVIGFSMVTQHPKVQEIKSENLKKAVVQLSKAIKDLQQVAMSMRMVPLSSTFQRLKRIILDMSSDLKKDIKVHIEGENTELDKMMIENITDPLIHIVRNAVDHGIEPPEIREKKGKTSSGNIYITAKNSGSDVLISIQDDGKGLDKEKILKKAIENGIIENKTFLNDDELIYDLIFHPGFSTKDEANEYSGRGVGLDIVQKNIQKIGGKVSVESQKDNGTKFTLRIPLTLAIIEGIIASICSQKFVIPISCVIETFKIKAKDLIRDNDRCFIYLRGICYPLIDLSRFFYGIETDFNSDDSSHLGVMVNSGTNQFVLVIDELINQQQVVIKSLPTLIKGTKGISGCTLLGDGSVALILDITSFTN